MGNEIERIVTPEDAQVALGRLEVKQKQAEEDVTLYVATLESQLRTIEMKVEKEILPALRKSLESATIHRDALLKKETEKGKKKIEKKYAPVIAFLTKNGFLQCSIDVTCSSKTDNAILYRVEIEQKGSYSGLNLMDKANEKTEIPVAASTAYQTACKNVASIVKRISEAQEFLLNTKSELQNMNAMERQGKSVVLREMRASTKDGAQAVAKIDSIVEERMHFALSKLKTFSNDRLLAAPKKSRKK